MNRSFFLHFFLRRENGERPNSSKQLGGQIEKTCDSPLSLSLRPPRNTSEDCELSALLYTVTVSRYDLRPQHTVWCVPPARPGHTEISLSRPRRPRSRRHRHAERGKGVAGSQQAADGGSLTRRGGGEAQSAHRSLRQLRVGAKGARRRAVHHRTLLAPRAFRPCEAAGRAPACVPMPNGHGPPTSAIAIPKRPGNTPAPALAPGPFARRATRSASATRAQPGMHACIGARGARLHRFGVTRALSVPAERHGRTARYGRASGTASGAIGRRPSGQPTAVAQSSWPRRVQQFERASDSRAARGRPEDGHCLPDCTRHRARRRARSAAAGA